MSVDYTALPSGVRPADDAQVTRLIRLVQTLDERRDERVLRAATNDLAHVVGGYLGPVLARLAAVEQLLAARAGECWDCGNQRGNLAFLCPGCDRIIPEEQAYGAPCNHCGADPGERCDPLTCVPQPTN
ncbi:hypothetical protein [Kitasatospora sp. NPDC058478]|uniref:hypothetical protein n=1 Tax=unclassified Kitasatospora TaxID=2633591 RepID=UPI003653D42F